VGEVFGKFELQRKLAVGGMAEIFLASVQGPEGFLKTVAIKRILPHLTEDQDFVTMFLDEARLVARFNHPNIVQIYELGDVEGRYFLSMEFVHGVSMSKVLKACRKRERPLPLEYGAKIVSFACDGLDYAHNFADADGHPLNLIHRDVSPQNLMLSYDGVVKVLDFGIAKAAGNLFQTRSSSLKGKAAYMSPEQITQKAGGLDRRSDVFALGIVLYEFATGRRPYEADTELELMMSIVQKPIPDPRLLNPILPEGLAVILDKALAKDREQRYASCRALRQDLEQFLVDQRLMVDTYALSAFLRELIPPGDVRVGMTLPTPSRPSLNREEVDGALRGVRSDSGKSRPSPHTPTGRRPAPVVQDEEPATVLTPSKPISARLAASIPPEPLGDTTLRASPSLPPKPPAAGLPMGWMMAGLVLLGVIGAGGAFLFVGTPETDPRGQASRDAGLPEERGEDAGPAGVGPVGVGPDAGVAGAPEGSPDAGAAKAPEGSPDAGLVRAPEGSPDAGLARDAGTGPAVLVDRGHRKKRVDSPPPRDGGTIVEPPRPVAMAEGKGKLVVDSRPWTNVSIDGTSYGTTPLGPVDLEAGLHDVELLNRAGGIRVKKQIRILAGQTQRVMEKFGQGQLQVFVKPFGEVFVNGQSKGMTPLDGPITLYEGTHTVRVINSKDGKEETRQVKLTAGQTQKLIFDLR
jgi:serine/threonine protein kinase